MSDLDNEHIVTMQPVMYDMSDVMNKVEELKATVRDDNLKIPPYDGNIQTELESMYNNVIKPNIDKVFDEHRRKVSNKLAKIQEYVKSGHSQVILQSKLNELHSEVCFPGANFSCTHDLSPKTTQYANFLNGASVLEGHPNDSLRKFVLFGQQYVNQITVGIEGISKRISDQSRGIIRITPTFQIPWYFQEGIEGKMLYYKPSVNGYVWCATHDFNTIRQSTTCLNYDSFYIVRGTDTAPYRSTYVCATYCCYCIPTIEHNVQLEYNGKFKAEPLTVSFQIDIAPINVPALNHVDGDAVSIYSTSSLPTYQSLYQSST